MNFKLRVIASFFAALLGAGAANSSSLQDSTDRFTGNRTVSWSSMPDQPGTFSLSSGVLFHDGDKLPSSYAVWLTTYEADARLSKCSQVFWLLDGKRFTLPMTYSVKRLNGMAVERLTFTGGKENLESIASAAKVEFKICSEENEISNSDHDGLRMVLEAGEL